MPLVLNPKCKLYISNAMAILFLGHHYTIVLHRKQYFMIVFVFQQEQVDALSDHKQEMLQKLLSVIVLSFVNDHVPYQFWFLTSEDVLTGLTKLIC